MPSTHHEDILRSLIFVVIIGLFIRSGHDAQSKQRRQEPSVASNQTAVKPRLSVEDLFRQIKHQIGSNREEIFRRWRNPDSVIATTVNNRHVPEVIDSVFRLFFTGLEVVVYQSGYDHCEFVARLLVEENRYLGKIMPNIGSPIDSLAAMLGAPDKRDGNTITYTCINCESGGVEFLQFHVRNTLVPGIELNFWVE